MGVWQALSRLSKEGGAMLQDSTPGPRGKRPDSCNAIKPERQSQNRNFVLPGSLNLNMKRLLKEKHSPEYQSLYKLRYQVYCHEAHFLNPANYPSGLEIDEYDAVSEHFLATNADNSDEIIGTVRLVKWSERLSFPTAAHYKALLLQLDRLRFPLDSTAEISRLCISKLYRKRAIDGLLGIEGYTENRDPRRHHPMILLKLLRSMYCASKEELGITHWIATFEDGLYRLLNRYGIRFELITQDEIEYYGKVKIYGASIQYIEQVLKITKEDLYEFFCEQSEVH